MKKAGRGYKRTSDKRGKRSNVHKTDRYRNDEGTSDVLMSKLSISDSENGQSYKAFLYKFQNTFSFL